MQQGLTDQKKRITAIFYFYQSQEAHSDCDRLSDGPLENIKFDIQLDLLLFVSAQVI